MNRIHLLLELQNLDVKIEENRQSQKQLQARLADNGALAAATTGFQTAEREENDLRARLKALELEVKGLEDQIRGVDGRLYGGQVKNAKELTGLERDEEMLKRHKGELEDRMLTLMEQLEQAQAVSHALRDALDRTTSTRAMEIARDQDQSERLNSVLRQLESERSKLRGTLSPTDLQVYDALHEEKKGRAVAPIKGTSCTACGVAIPSGLASRARVGEELVYCSNCGRILVPA